MSEFTAFANGKLLRPMQWVGDALFVAPGGHRMRNALGLSIGLYIGDTFSNLISGQKFNGEKIDPNDYPAVLRPLYGIMSYNRYSDDPSDRWKFVARGLITAAFGATGAALGSYDFFRTKTPNIKEQLKDPWHHSKYGITDAELHDFTLSKGPDGAEKTAALSRLTDKTIEKVEKWLSAAAPNNIDKHVYNEISHSYLLPSALGAIPGSALGSNSTPLPLYSWLLGERFRTGMLGYKVAMPGVGKWWSNATIPDKLSLNHLITDIVEKIGDPKNLDLHNETIQKKLADRIDYALKGAIEPIYKNLQPHDIENMRKELLQVSESSMKRLSGMSKEEAAKVIKDESEVIKTALKKKLGGTGINEFLHRNGVKLEEINFEEHGVSGLLAKFMGADLKQYTYEYQRSLKAQGLPNSFDKLTPGKKLNPAFAYARQTGVVLGTVGLMGGLTGAAVSLFPTTKPSRILPGEMEDEDKPNDGVSVSRSNVMPSAEDAAASSSAATGKKHKDVKHTPVSDDFFHKAKDLINGPFLNLSEAGVETFNVAPSGHRLMCAAGLFAAMIVGDKLMQALTHRTIGGVLIGKEKLHPVLHGLFDKNLMLYGGRHSMEYKDQWMHVLRQFVPSITGIYGVMEGSSLFFRKKKELVKHAQYLDEFDQKAAFAQSGPWAWLSGLASLPSASMGVSLFPIPINYGTALGGRFSLAQDRAVLFPGVAEWWSNNHSSYPMQPAALLKRMAAYGAYNPSHELKQLDEMVPGILKHWYNNVTQKQIDDFTNAFEAYRMEGLAKGLRGKDLERDLRKHITGAGLEETLEKIGMDPTKAILGNNGLSGRIGNFLGAKDKVMSAQIEYIHAYQARKAKRMEEKMRQLEQAAPTMLPTSGEAPTDISTSKKWQDNVEKTASNTARAEPKSIADIAAKKPAGSHADKASESKENPSLGLSA